MIRKLVFIILASALLSFVLAAICQFAFPNVVPYAAGENEALSWWRQVAFLVTASAWISAEVSGLFAIVLAAQLWNRHSRRET
jgi:hypothetical protein